MMLAPFTADPQALARLRGDLIDLCAGTAFIVVGLATFAIAVIRRRTGIRIFYWLGLWSAVFGLNSVWNVITPVLHPSVRALVPYANTLTKYMVLPFASLSWMEATRGWMRTFSAYLVWVELFIAAGGFIAFLVTGDGNRWLPANSVVAAIGLAVLFAVVWKVSLFNRYSVLPARGFFAFGTFVFTVQALLTNIVNPLGYHMPNIYGYIGFAFLLAGFGHSALQMTLDRERRLVSIESELEIARQIQTAILPKQVPSVRDLRIEAQYHPAASVAGDFYEFIAVDGEHAGVLVADVCGHGVPAALIASMLKGSVQSVMHSADRPGAFLAALNRNLCETLNGKLASAAYLWMDMAEHRAVYSAAGHPPLLHKNKGLEWVESNGLLFGVLPNEEFPERAIELHSGDRLSLYTDGISEPETPGGEAFGEARLPEMVKLGCSAEEIVAELRRWQPVQDDDRTLVIIDVL